MILGVFSFAPEAKAPSAFQKIRELSISGEISFHHVSYPGFEGGYFMNDRLPYSESAFCFFDESKDILVLISGTIYNRSEIDGLCNKTLSVSVPELIADLFLLEGSGFVKKLNGDFAVFILQPGKQQAYLFRDQVGIRPLAYTIEGKSLYFSSDTDGLARVFSEGQNIDSDYLTGYFKYIDYRKTPCQKVRKLLPGHFLHFTENQTEVKKYWEPEKIKIDGTLSHSQMLAELRFLLEDAVRIRCDNRFNAGAHVSSGLDSGIVAALARKEYTYQETFWGFSWSPADFIVPEGQFDERDLVRKLCLKTGISPLFSDLSKRDFPKLVSSFYDNHGFFSEDRTVHQAVAAGTNLIFSGWGGDEFISTGTIAIESDLLRGLKLRLYLRRNQIRHLKKFIINLAYFVLMPAMGILDRSTVRSFRDDARHLKEPFKKSDIKAVRQFYFHTSRHHHHLGMLNFYHLQYRCESWFVMGFRKGVEYRYPLLDKRIIEYMLKVPSALLCQSDYFRPVLREIGEGILPDEIRLNKAKSDPVYWSWMDGLFAEASYGFMEEADDWKQNPDLHFVDFGLLKKDITKFRDHSPDFDSKVLFRTLIYLKAVHEFTLAYRK